MRLTLCTMQQLFVANSLLFWLLADFACHWLTTYLQRLLAPHDNKPWNTFMCIWKALSKRMPYRTTTCPWLYNPGFCCHFRSLTIN